MDLSPQEVDEALKNLNRVDHSKDEVQRLAFIKNRDKKIKELKTMIFNNIIAAFVAAILTWYIIESILSRILK